MKERVLSVTAEQRTLRTIDCSDGKARDSTLDMTSSVNTTTTCDSNILDMTSSVNTTTHQISVATEHHTVPL